MDAINNIVKLAGIMLGSILFIVVLAALGYFWYLQSGQEEGE